MGDGEALSVFDGLSPASLGVIGDTALLDAFDSDPVNKALLFEHEGRSSEEVGVGLNFVLYM